MKYLVCYAMLIVMACGLCYALCAPTALAITTEEMTSEMGKVGSAYGQPGDNPQDQLLTMIGSIISTILTLLGVIVLVIIIYAGFLWMTAGGDPEQVGKAKKWLTNGVIGLVLILAAYAIAGFVVDQLVTATQGQQ